jgi:glutathione synthase/RimK-type ligase-like ATP-grasp enzyme
MWMANLVRKEDEGYRVINDTDVLRLTSDKLACAFHMYNAGLPHPRTWEAAKTWDDGMVQRLWYEMSSNYDVHKVVVKPYTSMDQGANVKVANTVEEMRSAIRGMPTGKVIVQEVINYTGIFRVIVIGGRALPMSWVDRPSHNRWRVSVCLNRNMQFVSNPDQELLRVAEQTQEVVSGEINFIDVFSTPSGRYILSEINTACNLLIHEGKARAAGHRNWNIAHYIAKYLDRQARGLHGYY